MSRDMPVAPSHSPWGPWQRWAGTTFGLIQSGISAGLNGMFQPELGCSHKKVPQMESLKTDYVPPVKAGVGVPGQLGGLMMSRLHQSHGSPVTSGDAHVCAATPSGSMLQWGGGEGWKRVCEGSLEPRSCPPPRPC